MAGSRGRSVIAVLSLLYSTVTSGTLYYFGFYFNNTLKKTYFKAHQVEYTFI